MSMIGKIVARFRPKAAAVDSSSVWRGDGVWEVLGGSLRGGAGAPTEREALAVTAVYASVSLIAGAISALPMQVYRRAADGDLSLEMENPLWWVLNEQFCPRWSAAAGWSFVTASKLLHGDGFAEILRDRNGGIRGLVPIHPNRVEVIATPDGERLIYRVLPDPTVVAPTGAASRTRVIDQDDMLHVPGFGFNGLRGLSALKNALRVSGRLAISAQEFSSHFLQNHARPDFALKSAANLTNEQFDQLNERLGEHLGPKNSGRPMILEGGLDIKELTMPLEDMQLLEMRKFQIEDVARAFNVPPFMIGHTEKTSAWGSGVEAMGAGFVRYTLRDHLNAFQNEINRKFFRSASTVAEFDTFELERGDIAAMFNAARIGLGRAGEPALLAQSEARRMLRLPKKLPADASASAGQQPNGGQ